MNKDNNNNQQTSPAGNFSSLIKAINRKPTTKSYWMVKDWLLSLRTRSLPGCPHVPLLVATSVLKAVRQDKDKERYQVGKKETRLSLLADLGYRKSEGNTHTIRINKQVQQDGMM